MPEPEGLEQLVAQAAQAADARLAEDTVAFGTVRLARLTGAERVAMRELLVNAMLAGAIQRPMDQQTVLCKPPIREELSKG